MKPFETVYPSQPWRNRRFKVRGICQFDVLNPCWDNRPSDIPGKHWSGLGDACPACASAAAAALYSRHHKTPAYVLKHADGSHTWTAPFSITDGAVALPPGSQIVATFLDGERRD